MSHSSLKGCAVAAALSAATTFLLWLLPRMYDSPTGVEQSVALHDNAYYLARLWVNFVHIFLALTAYGATAWLLWKRSPALAGFGFLWFLLWGFVELIGVTANIFAVNGIWRAQFSTSTPEVQDQLRALLLGFQGVWDALFFLLLACFLLGTTLFGVAASRGTGLERWVGYLFLLAAPLTVGILIGGYTSFSVFDGLVAWVYPVLQPANRGLLGVWLWSEARRLRSRPGGRADAVR